MSIGAINSWSAMSVSPPVSRTEGCRGCQNGEHGAEKAESKPPEEQKEEVVDLKRTDAEVKAHEAAHMAAGGQYAGGATYQYQTGPDGKRYAVGGEVSIDTSSVSGDPQATITKMQTVRRAALAPAEPSGQDRAVAAAAASAEVKARQELTEQRKSEAAGGTGKQSEAEGTGVGKEQEKQSGTYDSAGVRSPKLGTTALDLVA